MSHYLLKNYRLAPNDLVLLCLDRNEYLLIAILAIIKCGGVYVPVNTEYPIERIHYIIQDTKSKLALTINAYKDKFDNVFEDLKMLTIDDDYTLEQINKSNKSNLNLKLADDNLAYIIYTSGTTGNPKGVLQQHNSVVSLFDATCNLYKFRSTDIWMLFHSYTFDFSVWEIFGALLYGGTLILPSMEETKDFEKLYNLCYRSNITVLNFTPSAFYQFSKIILRESNKNQLESLRYIIFGGEKLNFSQLANWFDVSYSNKTKLINMYGITELTVHTTYKIIHRNLMSSNTSLIGNILPDQKGYVLDSSLNVLPIGAIGELYVGGAGLARGYLNNEKLTLERFIANPFQTNIEKQHAINSRLYKTGDLVRMLPNGEFEYIGRNDCQIKIRGYRIETADVQIALSKINCIKESVVVVLDIKNEANNIPVNKIEYTSNQYNNKINLAIDKCNVSTNENFELLPIQEWLFNQNLININHWNQSFLIKAPKLNKSILINALNKLIKCHDAFRLKYKYKHKKAKSSYVQYYTNGLINFKLLELDISQIKHKDNSADFVSTINHTLTNWQSNFDIKNGDLFSFGYIYGYPDGSTRIYCALHHLIVDVVSWHIILHDLQKIYNELSMMHRDGCDENVDNMQILDTNCNRYKDWVYLIKQYAINNVNEKKYWQTALFGHKKFNTQLNSLLDSTVDSDNIKLNFSLDHNHTNIFIDNAKLLFNGKIDNMVLAIFCISLHKMLSTSQLDASNIYVTLEGHGRENLGIDISRTIGWFTTMFPVKLSISDNLESVINSIKKALKNTPSNGIGYGALYGYSNLPLISFNYLGKISHKNSDSFWCITNDYSGQNISQKNNSYFIVEFLAYEINGEMAFSFVTKLNQCLANELLNIFKYTLIEFIETASKNYNKHTLMIDNIQNSDHKKHAVIKNDKISMEQNISTCAIKQDNVESNKCLVAYYVSDEKIDQEIIRSQLLKHLPQYSIPQIFIKLDKIPLTLNGKVDTKALPSPNDNDGNKYTMPNNEKEYLICKIFADVLSKKQVGIHDDFFLFGGDSISAIKLVMFLQHHFNVSIPDIYAFRTPSKLAQNISFSDVSIKNRLLRFIEAENTKINQKFIDNQNRINNSVQNYLNSIKNLQLDLSRKNINNVLLTGATGYLGCNLLNELIVSTDYNIYVLVRGNSNQHALDRVQHKYNLYFEASLDDSLINSRVFVIYANLENSDLGVSKDIYEELTHKIDSIIHAAALVKQFGSEDEFYNANLQATINLIHFAQYTKQKDFHYISTVSVLKNNPDFFEYWGNYYAEEHAPDNLELIDGNVYLKTKLQAEQYVVQSRNYGINGSIYRVGNLAFMAKNLSVQENIETIGFTHWLRYLFHSKAIFPDVKIDISPVDLTAAAIVKLFDKKCTNNSIYHVFNSHPFDLVNYMQYRYNTSFKLMSIDEFINHIITDLEQQENKDLVSRFLLANGWMEVEGVYQFLQRIYLQDKTQYILQSLDFEWYAIKNEQIDRYLENIKIY